MAASTGSESPHGRGQGPMLASQRPLTHTQIKPGYFPLGYKAGFSQWWAGVTPAAAENTVLSFIPYLQKPPTHTQVQSAPVSPQRSVTVLDTETSGDGQTVRTNSISDPYGPRSWQSTSVKLSGKDRALNEFSVERVGEDVEENLVMLHGYGAGLGFFYRNFEGLSRVKGWKLYALDMLGMGRSSRPPFRVHAKDQAGKIREAENWFIDALEEWRILKKIDKFTLLGHSMGGYMAVAYALKYPGHLNKLILASPVGIPEDPYAVQANLPEPEESTMANEFLQDQQEIVQGGTKNKSLTDNNHLFNAKSKADTSKLASEQDPPPRKPLPKWLVYLWDANISPFSLVRWAGPLGPRFVSGWTTRRFSHLPADESQALHTYAYSLFRQRGSGEYALAYILAPGAFARSPLIRRIHGVGRQTLPSPPLTTAPTPSSPSSSSLHGVQSHWETSTPASTEPPRLRETGIPVVLMYGEKDWMDVAGGYAAQQKIKEEKVKALKTASAAEKERESGSAKVLIIKDAGHHLYLEGWEEFNEVLREEMEATSRDTRRLRAKALTQANGQS